MSVITTAGSGPCLCLDAFIVAIYERWFACSKELQLASFHLCMECRNVPTLHLRVDVSTPRRLLPAADSLLSQPDTQDSTRVPRLRALRVTWMMRSVAELSRPIHSSSVLKVLTLGLGSNNTVELCAWWRPPNNQVGSRRYNQGRIERPVSTCKPFIGEELNEDSSGASMTSRVKLKTDPNFNQAIEGVAWPASLQQLTFGNFFNQSIEGVTWPVSLQ